MRKDTNVVVPSDLLFYAEEIGISWNRAHDSLFRESRLLDGYSTYDIYYDDLEEHGWTPETKRIIKGFMEKEGLTEFLLVEDH